MLVLSMSLLDQVVFLVIGLLGLVTCFTGSRLLRFWLALAGLMTGFYLGLKYGGLVLPVPLHQLVLAIFSGLILAGVFSIFTRVGSLLAGAGVMALLADQVLRILPLPLLAEYHLYILLSFVLLGVVLGVLKIKVFLILASAFSGGWLASFSGGGFIASWPLDQAAVRYFQLQGGQQALILISTTVLLILGAWVQFSLARRAGSAVRQPDSRPAANAGEPAAATPAELILPERQADHQIESEGKTE